MMHKVHEISSSDDEGSTALSEYTSNTTSKPAKVTKRRPKEVIEAEKAAKKAKVEEQKRKKELDKKAKELEKAKQQSLKEVSKLLKPGECIKLLTINVDMNLIHASTWGGLLLSELQTMTGLRINLVPVKSISTQTAVSSSNNSSISICGGIGWTRDKVNTDGIGTGPLIESAVEEEQDILVVLRASQFIDMLAAEHDATVNSTTLASFTTELQALNKRITLVIMDLEKELRKKKVNLTKPMGTQHLRTLHVTKETVEMALVDMQVDAHITSRNCESGDDLAKLVKSYTKAVADRPFKCKRMESEFSFDTGSVTGGCRLTNPYAAMYTGDSANQQRRDFGGVDQLWRKQLLQWKGVTGEMAGAVLAAYPTPRSLYNAYKTHEGNGARMLENLEIRRGVGVLANSRRLGKELSRRLYEFLTTASHDHIIK